MPDPEITAHERNLRKVFWSGRESDRSTSAGRALIPALLRRCVLFVSVFRFRVAFRVERRRHGPPVQKPLAVHVARLSVLFEDLRLESTAARYMKPIPQTDTTSKNYRYWYFLRRMLVTLNEFASAFHQINTNDEWKRIRKGFEPDTEKRWNAAVKYFSTNRPKWKDLRDSIGGHLNENAVAYAVDQFRPDSTGRVEIVVHREEQTAGIRLLYAEEIVAIALHQALGPGDHTDDQVRAYVNELFRLVLTAEGEAVKAVHVISAVYIVERFRS